MASYNRTHVLSFIAQLLHPKSKVADSFLPAPQGFWNRLVQIGSSQLVLPAIYGALKRKKLEHHVPNDLLFYLNEIRDLNCKRNKEIFKQIFYIHELFSKNDIEYVFLKGAALLITKPYDTKNERMVGDIDILVSENAIIRAQEILINQGFVAVSDEFSFTEGLSSKPLHLKRIIHPNYIAAVELHETLLKKENYLISPKDVIENKVQAKKGFWIPSKYHVWQHTILNWQYNDIGMAQNSLAFRSVVDGLYLEPENVVVKIKSSPKAIKHFYSLLSYYYEDYKNYYPLKKMLYKWKLKSIFFYRVYVFFKKLISFTHVVFHRIMLFLRSKIYQRRILKNYNLVLTRILNFWNK